MRIKTGTQELMIKDSMVIRFQAEGALTTLYLDKGRSMILDESLDHIEDQLRNSGFLRVHKEHLVNVDHIISIPELSSEGIVLSDDSSIPAEKRSLIQIKEIIENHINENIMEKKEQGLKLESSKTTDVKATGTCLGNCVKCGALCCLDAGHPGPHFCFLCK